jgi:hypothetical protein
MKPSIEDTYSAVAVAMRAATADPRFGMNLLMGGKTKGIAREVWLSKRISEGFSDAGFHAEDELTDHRNGRIDIAILSPGRKLECAIEIKYYFCHACKWRGTGHQFLANTQTDFAKRSHLGVPLQAVVFAADYQMMPPNGKALGLYGADTICKHLSTRGPMGFDRFERDLFDLFSPTCDIFPTFGAACPTTAIWRASHHGAAADLRAWILELR